MQTDTHPFVTPQQHTCTTLSARKNRNTPPDPPDPPSSQTIRLDELRQPQGHHLHQFGRRAQVHERRAREQNSPEREPAEGLPSLPPGLGECVLRGKCGTAPREVVFEPPWGIKVIRNNTGVSTGRQAFLGGMGKGFEYL